VILTGDGVDVLLAQALASPSGNDDESWNMGRVITWDDISGVNTVSVNGTVIPNMKSIVGGIGGAYKAGDNVLIQRKQTQYVIHGKLQAPGLSSGSQPAYNTGAGGVITGTTGTWKDLDAGAGSNISPSLTVRVGTNQNFIVSFGCEYVSCDRSGVTMGVNIAGAFTMNPGLFQGDRVSCASYGSVNAADIPMSKTIYYFQGTGIGSQRVAPGVITISLKYNLALSGTGTSANVHAPWISFMAF
jgi:hypothetical protein